MLFKKIERSPQMIDVCLGYLVVGLDKQHSLAEVLEAGLDRQLNAH